MTTQHDAEQIASFILEQSRTQDCKITASQYETFDSDGLDEAIRCRCPILIASYYSLGDLGHVDVNVAVAERFLTPTYVSAFICGFDLINADYDNHEYYNTFILGRAVRRLLEPYMVTTDLF